MVTSMEIGGGPEVKESGKVTFETGATRSDDLVGIRYDLLPPIGVRRAAEGMAHGAEVHGELNWEKGLSISECLNHASGHINAYLAGDRSDDHLGHLICNAMMAVTSEEMWPHLNQNLRGVGDIPTAIPKE